MNSSQSSGDLYAETAADRLDYALPCIRYERQQKRPKPSGYPENPVSIGEHIRKRRMDLKLYQRDVSDILQVCEATISKWEINKGAPLVYNYPLIIEFLGYSPFEIDTSTFAGRLKEYRYKNGLSQEDMGKVLNMNESTIFNWERGEHTPQPNMLERVERLFGTNPE